MQPPITSLPVDLVSSFMETWEIEETFGTSALCSQCGAALESVGYFDDSDHHADSIKFFCEKCAQQAVDALVAEAEVFARTNCKITSELPPFYCDLEFRCTPEEYENGNRESYTENSHFCGCRHNCTNYEELISEHSDEWSMRGRAYYMVIHQVINNLIDEEISQKDLIRFSSEDDQEFED